MTNDKAAKNFDLNRRTTDFGENCIEFAQSIAITEITRPLVGQFIRSATSIGANYMEADGAESKKDFRHKIGICRKESKETEYWILMLIKALPTKKAKLAELLDEAHQLTLIFSKIFQSSAPTN